MFLTLPFYFGLHCKLHSRRSCPGSVLKQWKLVHTDTAEPSSKSDIFIRQNELLTKSHMTSDSPTYSENWCLFPGFFHTIIKHQLHLRTGNHVMVILCKILLFSLSKERKLKVCKDLFKLHLCFVNPSLYFQALTLPKGKTLCAFQNTPSLHFSNTSFKQWSEEDLKLACKALRYFSYTFSNQC